MWVERPDQLEAALATYSPTHVLLDHVTARVLEVAPTVTRVDVATDLQITGRPAQFGRGVIQDVSDKLLGQFVDCLQQRIGAASEAAQAVPAAPAPETIATVRTVSGP